MKSARSAQQGTEKLLVTVNQQDDRFSRDSGDVANELHAFVVNR